FLSCSAYNRYLHSFPTRRSSDLNFSSEVNNLRQMELERDNLRLLYKEGSREIKELDARINNTKSNIQHLIATSRSKVNKELGNRSEEHTSELQSRENIVCRLLLE